MDVLGTSVCAPVPIYAQSGEDRRNGVDKMILKSVDVLPHGLINSPAVFGENGDVFLDYVRWVRSRIDDLGADGYSPRLHFDVYGLLGAEMDGDVARMARLCERVATAADGLEVQLESPVYGHDVRSTADVLAGLRSELRRSGIPVQIVADDWCNSLDDIRRFGEVGAADMIQIKMPDLGAISNAVAAVHAARELDVGVFIGGSCTETDLTARASVQLAVAARAEQVLAKPGMGVDEAVAVTRNEMLRACMT
jgi:methylaspartate ammonia-lyase